MFPMTPLIPAPLIVLLLKEELKSQKLMSGLNQLGIVAEPYQSDLGRVILMLMGYANSEQDEALYTFYNEQLELFTALEIGVFQQQLDHLALCLYQELEAIRR